MGKEDLYVSDDLAEGIAYTVTNTPQYQTYYSVVGCLLRDVRRKVNLPLNCLLQVRSEVTFGVETPGGVVWRTLYFQFSTKRFLVVGR